MSTIKKTSTLASAALAFAFSASAMAADSPAGSSGTSIGAGDKVHCYGVHSCKGNSDCKTAEHQCKGQNACAGHGFKGISAKECLDQGGVISDIKS
ncbi:hypothetical protein DV711_11185 [Motiliproteus coralliicola]|uniref:DUF2282 domain-containing protein n=1 Tax=Motiliproteus coralliicola TaxID=2283196 RepID=A0A369WE78_9GAMM|nr:hypothetical protein [Motiliproteus coralliicola]RDE19449.1 hypothetical protein DV711_11185 [Motiliproteus coralliicola]